jgi:hypothetical protein
MANCTKPRKHIGLFGTRLLARDVRRLPRPRRSSPLFPAWILLLTVALFASCKHKEPNQLDAAKMGAAKRLSLAGLAYTNHIVYVDASEGDSQANRDVAASLATMDSASVVKKTARRGPFEHVEVLEDRYRSDARYAAAINDPSSAETSVLSSLANEAKADALLWIKREYKVRAVSGFKGDRYTKWSGEVSSQMYVFDKTGVSSLRMAWLNESDKKEEGPGITGAQTISLLSDALDRATETTADILSGAALGRGLPQGLHDDEQSEAAQERAHGASEIGTIVRGVVLVALAAVAIFAFKTGSLKPKFVGVVLLAAVVYLLVGRGWWKDTILTILDFVKEAIFG